MIQRLAFLYLVSATFSFTQAAPTPEPAADPSAPPAVVASSEVPSSSNKLKIDRALLELRDPFAKPPAPVVALDPKSDLEKIPVADLKMLGVVTGPDRLRAMVGAPNGRTYFVSESMKIGTRKGVIRKITSNSIKIREKVVDVFGDEQNSDTEIALPKLEKKDLNGSAGW